MDSSSGIKNKDIFQVKIALTNNCVLRCEYCFVEKQKQFNVMSPETARKAIDLIMDNGSGQKIIKVYGGEPLLCFDLVEEITSYVRSREPKDRPVQMSLCTNAVLLEERHLDFLKENRYQLAISFDGLQKTQDAYRKFPDGRGTFDIVTKKFPLIFQKLSAKNVAANLSIVPSEVNNLFDNFKFILSAGFDTVNFEPVFGFQTWERQDQAEFVQQMKKVIKFIHGGLLEGKFFFLATINRELKYKTLSKFSTDPCPFVQCLEVQPDGDLTLIPFIRDFEKGFGNQCFVGSITRNSFNEKYLSCSYEPGELCADCVKESFFNDDSGAGKVVTVRNMFSIEYAQLLMELSQKIPEAGVYMDEAKEHICF